MKALLKFFIISGLIVNLLFAQNTIPTIKTTQLSNNLYQFFIYINENNSANVFASIGQDGILLIDAGFTNTTELINAELKKLSDKKVKWIINTHYDGDHTLGNSSLGTDASIISHELCRNRLMTYTNFPPNGLPDITFSDSAKIFFNGEEIILKHFPGHTSSDIIVYFKKANIVFLGDLILSDSFPSIQSDGSVYSMEKSLTALSNMFGDDTRFLVSHGREIRTKEIKKYLEMISGTKQLLLKAIKKGMVPEEAKMSEVLKGWEKWNSELFPNSINTNTWIDILYSHLDEGRKLSAYTILKDTYEKSGLTAMNKRYHEICAPKKKKRYFIENDFNNWGYALLTEQKITDAIEVFKINTNEFPESANTFDSLGEAYMNAGNKELAIKNYEKSLELNPQNTNAVEQLKQLRK